MNDHNSEDNDMDDNFVIENLILKNPEKKIVSMVDLKAVQYANSENPYQDGQGCDFWTIAICIFAVFLIIGLLGQSSETFKKRFVGSTLGNDLSSKGWFLVSRSTCPFCVKQKDVVGNDYPNLIECDTGVGSPELLSQLCSSVNAYPTWINVSTGQKVEGFMPEEALRSRLL